MISLKDYLTASGSYPDREKNPELNQELLNNASNLLDKVNKLLEELQISKVRVSSGFRPSTVNASISGAAPKSNHTKCMAVDIIDTKDQSIANKLEQDFIKNGDNSILVRHGLYMESPKNTIGKNTNWVHLQTKPTKRRIFIP
jgi:hypothetical protein